MTFQWDSRKARSNLAKHQVSFEEATSVFEDPLFVEFYDPDHSINEHRYVIVGTSDRRRILVVSYVEKETAARIISARRATKRERQEYEKE